MSVARGKLAFPLDYPTLELARPVAERLSAAVGVLKVGLELFVREGPRAVAMCREVGAATFLDLKLHDIPETVQRAVGSAIESGARYLTVHAGGGPRMLEAAAERVVREGSDLTLLAVTVLTSLDEADLVRVGVHDSLPTHTANLARLAYDCGVRGLVCSPLEVAALRQQLGRDVVLVTPGIRPSVGVARPDDQKRVSSPSDAIRSGSDLLVVGRPIRDASNPLAAAQAIVDEIEQAQA